MSDILKFYLDYLNPQIGKHREIPDSNFDEKELRIGIKIEMEHTDDPEIAKEIAKDHLSECPKYYSFLIKMERECKKRSDSAFP